VITALIVTQGNVGDSLKAAFERFAGSACGVVYGGAVAFAIPHGNNLSRDRTRRRRGTSLNPGGRFGRLPRCPD
jgi:hypothetical protein